MKYADNKITRYLKDLSKKLPAPGGGSSAALSASMAAALISMVCRFTLGKPGYEKYQSRIRKILDESIRFQNILTRLIDKDVAAYKSRNFDLAIKVPAGVAESSLELLKLTLELSVKGKRNLASDTLMAAMLCEASFMAGLAYVKVNVNSLKNKKNKYNKIKARLVLLSRDVKKIRKKVEGRIG